MKKVLAQAKITSNMHLTIPKKVQEKLGGVEEGQYIIFYEEKNNICIGKGEVKFV